MKGATGNNCVCVQFCEYDVNNVLCHDCGDFQNSFMNFHFMIVIFEICFDTSGASQHAGKRMT